MTTSPFSTAASWASSSWITLRRNGRGGASCAGATRRRQDGRQTQSTPRESDLGQSILVIASSLWVGARRLSVLQERCRGGLRFGCPSHQTELTGLRPRSHDSTAPIESLDVSWRDEMTSASRYFDPGRPGGYTQRHVRQWIIRARHRAPRESPRVRDADLRPLLPVHQPASRRGGPRDRRRAAPCLRASRHRLRGALAVVCECGPGVITPTHAYPSPDGPPHPAPHAPGAVPLVGAADAGRPQGCLHLAGRSAGGGRRRPRDRPPARHQVEPDPPARGGGRAARRRPGVQHPADRSATGRTRW